MTIRFRRLLLRAETTDGPFGVNLTFDLGLNVIWANNTSGKSTCLQGILYGLGLEKMLSPRREIPLTYVMTDHVTDPATGEQHRVLESSVWIEFENSAGTIITVRRGVVSSADRRLVSVYDGPVLTSPGTHYQKHDYFVLDAGAATRDAGFHRMLAEFIGWDLPTVRRFNGDEIPLYMETLFPLVFVEQKSGWSAIPAPFPTYFQIRDVGRNAVEFLLGLDTHSTELKRQQIALELASARSSWDAKRGESLSMAGLVNSRVEGVPTTPAISLDEVDRAYLAVFDNGQWRPLEDVASGLRRQTADMREAEVPLVEHMAPMTAREIEDLVAKIGEIRAYQTSLFQSRQEEIAQGRSIAERLADLEADLQKNRDVLKITRLGSEISSVFPATHCPTCQQPIADTLLAQEPITELMSVEENVGYIEAQLKIFQQLEVRNHAALADLDRELSAVTSTVNDLSARLRALRADQVAPSHSPSVAVLEERLRLEGRLQALEHAEQRFDMQKMALADIAARHTRLLEVRSTLPSDRLSEDDKAKIHHLEDLIQDQARQFQFTTFSPDEIGVSLDNFRPVKEGFEIGFELSGSDAIRLKWAYQLALLELARQSPTNHPGFVIFDEPRQQETSKVSLMYLLNRAAAAKQAGQQVIVATSQGMNELTGLLGGIEHRLHSFDHLIFQRL